VEIELSEMDFRNQSSEELSSELDSSIELSEYIYSKRMDKKMRESDLEQMNLFTSDVDTESLNDPKKDMTMNQCDVVTNSTFVGRSINKLHK